MKNILILVMPFLFCPSATAAEVVFKTVKGTFVLNIDEEKAPVTAQNFIQYVQDGFFDGLIFHRVIPGFVIQGGGFTSDMQPRQTRPPIVNEAAASGLKTSNTVFPWRAPTTLIRQPASFSSMSTITAPWTMTKTRLATPYSAK